MESLPNKGLRSPLIDQADEKITVSHIYKLNCNDLKKMFVSNKQDGLQFLTDHQGNRGIIQKLSSDAKTGIVGDEKDLDRRMKHFGENLKPLSATTNLFSSIKQTLREPIWAALIVSALVSALFECWVVGVWGLVEGITIVFTTFLLVLITALADYDKDKRLIALQALIKDENVPVIRGKSGSASTISIWNLVVGDVILLETGSNIPADCLILESNDLKISYQDVDQVKSVYDDANEDSDPFLLQGSKILRGTGKAMVCAVGKNSSMKKEDKSSFGVDMNTPLQKKLGNLEKQFTYGALVSAAIILLAYGVRLSIEVSMLDTSADDYVLGGFPGKTLHITNKLTSLVNIIVVLIVVSIPEGIPLTIGISLAFSVMKMYKEKILVRKLDAPEKMGKITDILCGKTGTLTKNKMKVAQFYCEEKLIINNRKDTLTQCDISKEALQRIQESILYNCDARVEMDEKNYKAVGNGTEVGLLKFLQNADYPIHRLIEGKHGQVLMRSPYSPENKRSAVAIRSLSNPDMVCFYIKGAPEILINWCTTILKSPEGQEGVPEELTDEEKTMILEHVSKMATQPLRVIGMGYFEMPIEEFENGYNQDGDARKVFDQKLNMEGEATFTWLGAFGMKDTIRPKVIQAVNYAQDKAQLNVRLVSGDHSQTASMVAYQTGILTDKDKLQPYAIMEGSDFRAKVGMPIEIEGEDGGFVQTNQLENQQKFNEIIEQLRVLARATPTDKEILIRGLKYNGRHVAVTGDGISDIKCLETATVGIAMGSGVSAAKQASDLVLTEDNFDANVQAIMWGRNIYLNVARFLQFQVTVNLSCLLTVLIGGMMIGESPFSAVQLLWINLIMDTFAAIALSTEPPISNVTQGPPLKAEAQLMTKFVWWQVIGTSIWITFIMVIMFMVTILSENYLSYVPSGYNKFVTLDDGTVITKFAVAGQEKEKNLTLIFNIFIFLQLFNQINCRKVGPRDFNVFEEFTHNYYFLMILFGTFFGQYASCTYLQVIFNTTDMTNEDWGTAVAIGSTSLLISPLIKIFGGLVNNLVGDKIPSLVNEDVELQSKVLDGYSAANAPLDEKFLGGKQAKADGSDNEDAPQDNDDNFQEAA